MGAGRLEREPVIVAWMGSWAPHRYLPLCALRSLSPGNAGGEGRGEGAALMPFAVRARNDKRQARAKAKAFVPLRRPSHFLFAWPKRK